MEKMNNNKPVSLLNKLKKVVGIGAFAVGAAAAQTPAQPEAIYENPGTLVGPPATYSKISTYGDIAPVNPGSEHVPDPESQLYDYTSPTVPSYDYTTSVPSYDYTNPNISSYTYTSPKIVYPEAYPENQKLDNEALMLSLSAVEKALLEKFSGEIKNGEIKELSSAKITLTVRGIEDKEMKAVDITFGPITSETAVNRSLQKIITVEVQNSVVLNKYALEELLLGALSKEFKK
jgi:hypothetical protein